MIKFIEQLLTLEQETSIKFSRLRVPDPAYAPDVDKEAFDSWIPKMKKVTMEYLRIKSLLPEHAWKMYLVMDEDNRETRLLNNSIMEMRKMFNERPRPRKKVKVPGARIKGTKKQDGCDRKNFAGNSCNHNDSKRERSNNK